MAKILILFTILLLGFPSFDLCSATSPNKQAKIYEIRKGDFSVKITNWGATVISVLLPDSEGYLADVVLGFDSIAPYVNDTTYFGAIVGRVANRIKGAQFSLNGTHYKLVPNEGKNMLHGGHRGFSKVFWKVKDKKDGDFPYITFTYHSFDGEQGFPGDLDVFVTYKIVAPYQLKVIMKAKARNKATPVNLAQHTYWNLGGHDSGNILSNVVQIFSSYVTPVDESLIPTGEILPVAGSAYDFQKPKTVGSRIDKLSDGYDINYILDASEIRHGMWKVAVVRDPRSGRMMELSTNQPGVQFYTSNKLKGVAGKGGYVYGVHDALCLETQGFPDSVNHPNFPSQIVNPGQVYKHYMLYRFSS